MELIPVFSLIVLVATAATFILAVGAYIMYKIREKRERKSELPPQRYKDQAGAEIITADSYTASRAQSVPRAYSPEEHAPKIIEEKKQWR